MSDKICVSCQIEMRVKKNGVDLVSMDCQGFPIEIFSADLWHCPSCETELILGTGRKPNVIGRDACEEYLLTNGLIGDEKHVFSFWLNQKEKEQAQEASKYQK